VRGWRQLREAAAVAVPADMRTPPPALMSWSTNRMGIRECSLGFVDGSGAAAGDNLQSRILFSPNERDTLHRVAVYEG
jgi:hypothetical protein